MGLLCDLFVSTPEEALNYADSIGTLSAAPDPSGRKGMTSLEFGLLWAILEGRPFDPERHHLAPVMAEGDPWLYRFPDDFAALLLPLRGDQINRVAAAWAGSKELRWSPSGTADVIEDLVRLAGFAKAEGKGLYFWGSV